MDDVAAHRPPTLVEAEQYHSNREAAILAQQTASRANEEDKRRRMLEVHRDKIEAKQKLRLEKQRKEAELNASLPGGAEEQTVLGSFELFVPDLKPGEDTTGAPAVAGGAKAEPQPPPVESLPYTIVIQASSTDLPWHDPSAARYETLDEAKAAGLWNYPETPVQVARCRVFEDLWRKGHFMGGGLRFGGDFLIYPGQHSLLRFDSPNIAS